MVANIAATPRSPDRLVGFSIGRLAARADSGAGNHALRPEASGRSGPHPREKRTTSPEHRPRQLLSGSDGHHSAEVLLFERIRNAPYARNKNSPQKVLYLMMIGGCAAGGFGLSCLGARQRCKPSRSVVLSSRWAVTVMVRPTIMISYRHHMVARSRSSDVVVWRGRERRVADLRNPRDAGVSSSSTIGRRASPTGYSRRPCRPGYDVTVAGLWGPLVGLARCTGGFASLFRAEGPAQAPRYLS